MSVGIHIRNMMMSAKRSSLLRWLIMVVSEHVASSRKRSGLM